MSAEIFLDTNVFTYYLVATDPAKHATAELIVRDALVEGNGCISYQVVHECLNVALRKAEVALPIEAARAGFRGQVSQETKLKALAFMRWPGSE